MSNSKVSLDELYDRIIDLTRKASEGVINPLDIDVGRYIKELSKLFDNVDYEKYLIKDIRALNGLISILELQSECLRRMGLGLYLDKVLIKLKILKSNVNELARIFEEVWSPIASIEALTVDDIKEVVLYFENLKPLYERRLKRGGVSTIRSLESAEYYKLDKDIKSRMMELFNELVNYSGGKYIDYYRFIEMGNCIERAYTLSYLITEGYVDVKIDRWTGRVEIKPADRRIKGDASLALVIKK